MYYKIVEGVVRSGFQSLSKGDYESVLAKFLPQAHFTFMGHHAMGADTHDPQAIRQWFQRIFRLFPGIQFEVLSITVSGVPWATLVVTQLRIRATLRDGQPYQNHAVQVLRLRWGRVVDDLIVEDTHILVGALHSLAQQGVAEATANPLFDPVAATT